jgi:hypothetical protein
VVSQAGDATHSAATAVSQSFTVLAGQLMKQTITFPTIAKLSVGTTLNLQATANSGLPVSFTSETPGICTVAGSSDVKLTAKPELAVAVADLCHQPCKPDHHVYGDREGVCGLGSAALCGILAEGTPPQPREGTIDAS